MAELVSCWACSASAAWRTLAAAALILSALGFFSAVSWAWAAFNWAWALATAAFCAVMAAGWTLPSLVWASLVVALASAAWALATCSARSRASSCARVWPAVTLSPAVTSTWVTVPLVGKARSSDWAAATVPLPATAATTVPRVTVVVAVVVVDELLLVRLSRSAAMRPSTITALPAPIQRPRRMPARRSGSVVVAIGNPFI